MPGRKDSAILARYLRERGGEEVGGRGGFVRLRRFRPGRVHDIDRYPLTIMAPTAAEPDSLCLHHAQRGLYSNKMALITSGYVKMRSLSIKWP